MNELKKLAILMIESYKSNKIIMDFVRNEAAEKTADDIRVTAKEVFILIDGGNVKIKNRFDSYVKYGLDGCFLASPEFKKYCNS